MLDVVCFGEILWDIFEAGGRGTRAAANLFRLELGGAPANVATGLARLGVRSAVIGAVGRDRFGDALVAHLRGDGVDVRHVVKLPNRTGLTFVVRDARGEPEFLFYRHESADLAIRAQHISAPMGRARWVLVGSSTLMTRELAAATARFLDLARRQGAHVVVDLNVRAHLWSSDAAMRAAIARLLERADLLKASAADLDALGGAGHALRWLRRRAPRASLFVTRGAGVASALGEHGEVNARADRTKCVDATGAGDAFIAGALATILAAGAAPGSVAWRNPEMWRVALGVGHAMGRKAVSRPGAVAGLERLGRVRQVLDRVRGGRP